MKIRLFIYLFVAALGSLASCKHQVISGSGAIGTETRILQNFSAIEIEASLKSSITIDSSAKASLELNGYKNLLPYIKTEVKGDVLRIYTERPIDFDSDKDVIATITMPSITGLTIRGTGEAEIHGVVKAEKFSFVLKGASDVTIDGLDVNNFDADIAGAGSLGLHAGRINFAHYRLAGAGNVEAFPVVCNESSATLLGAGDLELNVVQKLDAEIKGAGSISYKGHPAINKRILGVGSIDDAN
jgi:hypothetical protein